MSFKIFDHDFTFYNFFIKKYLPTNKTIILALIILSATFNAFSAVGYKNYINFIVNTFFKKLFKKF